MYVPVSPNMLIGVALNSGKQGANVELLDGCGSVSLCHKIRVITMNSHVMITSAKLPQIAAETRFRHYYVVKIKRSEVSNIQDWL